MARPRGPRRASPELVCVREAGERAGGEEATVPRRRNEEGNGHHELPGFHGIHLLLRKLLILFLFSLSLPFSLFSSSSSSSSFRLTLPRFPININTLL
jgi:hypothetical protein